MIIISGRDIESYSIHMSKEETRDLSNGPIIREAPIVVGKSKDRTVPGSDEPSWDKGPKISYFGRYGISKERVTSRISGKTRVSGNKMLLFEPVTEPNVLTTVPRTRTLSRRADGSSTATTTVVVIVAIVIVVLSIIIRFRKSAARFDRVRKEAVKSKPHRASSTSHQESSPSIAVASPATTRNNTNNRINNNNSSSNATSNGLIRDPVRAEGPDVATLMQHIGYLEAQMANMRQQEELRRQRLGEESSSTQNEPPLPHPLADSRLEEGAHPLGEVGGFVGSVPVPVLHRGEPQALLSPTEEPPPSYRELATPPPR